MDTSILTLDSALALESLFSGLRAATFYPQHGRAPEYRCPNCGGKDVEGTAWIHLNSGEEVDGDPPYDHDGYCCPDCSDTFDSVCILYAGSDRCATHRYDDIDGGPFCPEAPCETCHGVPDNEDDEDPPHVATTTCGTCAGTGRRGAR